MDIVERLRRRNAFMSLIGDPRWTLTADPDPDCQDAAAEIERLREIEKDWQAMRDERDAARTGYDNLLDENRGLVKLESENERLRTALEPFARFFKSDNHDLSPAQDHTIVATFLGEDKLPLAELTIADFRRARAALSSTKDERMRPPLPDWVIREFLKQISVADSDGKSHTWISVEALRAALSARRRNR